MSHAHLYPIFDRVLSRAEKEAQLGQRAKVLWFYGLSGSGKSTLAVSLERRFAQEGLVTALLDGDNVRTGLNKGLGFSDADRAENLRRVGEVAKLFTHAGIITLCSFITPKREFRHMIRQIVGPEDFLEIYVQASFDACARRDPKGLYAKAATGAVGQFTGRDSTFEEPAPGEASLVIPTESESPEASLERVYQFVMPQLTRGSTPSPSK